MGGFSRRAPASSSTGERVQNADSWAPGHLNQKLWVRWASASRGPIGAGVQATLLRKASSHATPVDTAEGAEEVEEASGRDFLGWFCECAGGGDNLKKPAWRAAQKAT